MAQNRYLESFLLSVFLVATGLSVPVAAQGIAVAEDGVVGVDPADDNAAEEGPPAVAAGGMEIPREYRGAAMPLESGETASALRRAEEHFGAEEWARGLAVIDEVLARVTAPVPRGAASRAKPPRDEEGDAGDAAAAGGVLVGGGVVRLGGLAPAAVASDDELVDEPDVQPGEEVCTLRGILYHPVASSVRRRLLELPAEARDLSFRTFEPPAREALRAARALPLEKSFPELRRVAERYPLTRAGADAWIALGERYLGAGRPAEAAGAFEVRLELPFTTGTPTRATVLAQVAMCHLLAEAPRSAAHFLDELVTEHGEEIVPVRGEPVMARTLRQHAFFTALTRRAEAATSTGQDDLEGEDFSWLCRTGSFDRAVIPLDGTTLPELGSQAKWIYHLIDEAARKGPNPPRVAGASPTSGVSRGDLVFFRHGMGVVALKADTGKMAWRAGAPDTLTTSGMTTSRVIFSSSRGTQNVGVDLSLVVCRPLKPGGKTFVVGLEGGGQATPTRTGKLRFQGNSIVAYDARSGKLAWKAGSGEMQTGPTRGMVLASAPVPASGLLVVPALRGESAYAAAFTPGGKLAWLRRLYSYSSAFYARYGGRIGFGPPMAASEDYLVAASGHGLICALRASTGEVLWVTRHRSRMRRRQSITSGGSPPSIVGSRVIAAPPDSDYVHAFDLRTGRVLWERRPRRESTQVPVLGVDSERVYIISGKRVRALNLTDGKDAWRSEDIGYPRGEGVVTLGRLLVPMSQGILAVLDSATGKLQSKIRLIDTRLGTPGTLKLFLARGAVLACSPTSVFCIRPQKDSWKELATLEGKDPFQRVRLLRAEERYAEAIGVLEELLEGSKSVSLRNRVKKDLLTTARLAATESRESRFITELLEREEPIVTDRKELLTLRLLAASYLEAEAREEGGDAARETARKIYSDLCRLDGVFANSPDGFQVDVGAYASDALLDLRRTGLHVPDPEGEERARNFLVRTAPEDIAEEPAAGSPADAVRGATSRALAHVVLRSSHLAITRLAEEELARRAQARGDVHAAEELRLLLEKDFPAGDGEDLADGSVFSGIPGTPEKPVRGLTRLLELAGEEKFSGSFWIAGEDAFLASTTADSLPLPGLLAIAGTSIQIYDEDGNQSFTMELPYYPDVADIKSSLQSHVEEPASVRMDSDGLLLFTPAGLYRFAQTGGGPGDDVSPEGGTWKPKGFKLRWVSRFSHPLLSRRPTTSGFVMFGGVRIPTTHNFFPELAFDAARRPVVLLPDGELFAVDLRSGKYAWHFSAGEGNAASSPRSDGRWISVLTSNPAGIRLYPVPPSSDTAGGLGQPPREAGRPPPPAGSAEVSAPRRPRWVRGPQKGANQAALAMGKLVSAFVGQTLEVSDMETGRRLWGRSGTSGRLLFSTSTDLWFSETSGKLVARSARSGRSRLSVDLPEGGIVIDHYDETPNDSLTEPGGAPGGAGEPPSGKDPVKALLISRHPSLGSTRSVYYGRTSTGADLFLVRLGSDGKKLGELKLHSGAVTYSGGRLLAEDGSHLVVFNGEMEPEKWYTRVLRIDPAGKGFRELLSVEVQGKGTGQPPRVAVLERGIAVGNADGFGWFVPGDAPKEDPEEESVEKTTDSSANS